MTISIYDLEYLLKTPKEMHTEQAEKLRTPQYELDKRLRQIMEDIRK